MRKLLILLFLSFSLFSVYAQEHEKVYLFNNPHITETDDGYQVVNFDNTLLSGIPGEPTLPYQKIFHLLPQGEIADSIEITFEEEVEFPGQFQLYPAHYSIPYSFEGEKKFIKNNQLYNRDINYPEDPKGKLVTGFMKGTAVALCTFTPVRFNPVNKRVSYFKMVKVKIYSSTSNQQPIINNQNNSKSNSYQILIVTSPSFKTIFSL